jgi:hypothetical protein
MLSVFQGFEKEGFTNMEDWTMMLKVKIEALGEKPVPVPLFSHGFNWNRTRASAVTGRLLSS